MTTLLHIFLNVTKAREQVHSSVGIDTSNDHRPRPREGCEHVGPISYDQPCTFTGNTLREIILLCAGQKLSVFDFMNRQKCIY